MAFKKYVEIEWKEIRLKPFKDWGETKFYLNVATEYPSTFIPKNTDEKLISDLEQIKLTNESWVVRPKTHADTVLFSGYVEHLLQIGLTILESDEESPINIISHSSEKLAEILKSGAGLTGKIFPFLGLSSLLFSGIASLIKDRDDLLGIYIEQFRRGITLPIGKPFVGIIKRGNQVIGEVDLRIYIKPEETDNLVFYHDVEIFPFSNHEIGVYYSGDLVSSKQLYMIWTVNNWKSNPLTKMKRLGKHWVAVLDVSPEMEMGNQLEVAFTDESQHWDNKDGNNWVFTHFYWN